MAPWKHPDAPWPGPEVRDDENLVAMTQRMIRCIDRWPNRRAFYIAQADQFIAECEHRGLEYL